MHNINTSTVIRRFRIQGPKCYFVSPVVIIQRTVDKNMAVEVSAPLEQQNRLSEQKRQYHEL